MFKTDVGLNKSTYETERSRNGNCFLSKTKLSVSRFSERSTTAIHNRDIEEHENRANISKDAGENGEPVLFCGQDCQRSTAPQTKHETRREAYGKDERNGKGYQWSFYYQLELAPSLKAQTTVAQ